MTDLEQLYKSFKPEDLEAINAINKEVESALREGNYRIFVGVDEKNEPVVFLLVSGEWQAEAVLYGNEQGLSFVFKRRNPPFIEPEIETLATEKIKDRLLLNGSFFLRLVTLSNEAK